jgi:hypothetical protein
MFRLQLQLIRGTDNLIPNLNNNNAGLQMTVTPAQKDVDTHQALTWSRQAHPLKVCILEWNLRCLRQYCKEGNMARLINQDATSFGVNDASIQTLALSS